MLRIEPTLAVLVRHSNYLLHILLHIKSSLTFPGKMFELYATHPASHKAQPYLPW